MVQTRVAANHTLFLGSLAGLLYGLGARLAFKAAGLEDYLGLITIGFAVLVPVAIGALTVAFAPRKYKTSWVYGVFMPWVPCLLLAIIVAILQWEVAICIFMAVPIFLVMASLGGGGATLAFYLINKDKSSPSITQASLLGLVVLAPYLLTPIERQFAPPTTLRVVEKQITVRAGAETVWRNIISVPEIDAGEQRPALFRLLGLPTPLEATLSEPGPGGMRRAVYDNGLTLLEPVTEWTPPQRYSFAVRVDPASPPPPPFEQVGGPYFEVRQVGFTLEPGPAGSTVLHLRSQYRLSTWLNPYGQWWMDLLLGDLQNYILQIVKVRAEADPL